MCNVSVTQARILLSMISENGVGSYAQKEVVYNCNFIKQYLAGS